MCKNSARERAITPLSFSDDVFMAERKTIYDGIRITIKCKYCFCMHKQTKKNFFFLEKCAAIVIV